MSASVLAANGRLFSKFYRSDLVNFLNLKLRWASQHLTFTMQLVQSAFFLFLCFLIQGQACRPHFFSLSLNNLSETFFSCLEARTQVSVYAQRKGEGDRAVGLPRKQWTEQPWWQKKSRVLADDWGTPGDTFVHSDSPYCHMRQVKEEVLNQNKWKYEKCYT